MVNMKGFRVTPGKLYRVYRGKTRFVLFLFIVAIMGCQEESYESNDPNIIVIMVDDMGFSDISSYGGEIEMSNLDKLSDNGLKFKQFYNAGRCCPSRASLLSGQYAHKTGLGYMTSQDYGKPGYRADLGMGCTTIAEILKADGYGTYMAGKWHLTKNFSNDGPKDNWPLQRGFDKFFGTLIGVGSYWDPLSLAEGNNYIEPGEDFYYTEEITKKAVTYIEGHSTNAPFFLYMAYTAPHFPLHARQSAIDKQKGKFSKGWDALRRGRYDRMVDIGLVDPKWNLTNRDEKSIPWDNASDKEWEASRMEAYAATLSHVDDGIGEIIKTLEKRDQLENTVIIFLSDNGADYTSHRNGKIDSSGKPWVLMKYVTLKTNDGETVVSGDIPGVNLGPKNTYGSYGLRWANLSNAPFRKFKTYAYEGGIATPFIIHWPAIIKDKGSWREQPAHIIDIMATCIDVAGVNYPDKFQGRKISPLAGKSLLPIIRNDEDIHPEGLYWEHQGNKAARLGKWKIVSSIKDGSAWELYDMENDRTETKNLASDYPEIVVRLEQSYNQWAQENNVLPWEELSINTIPPVGNPLTRSGEELDEAIRLVEQAIDSVRQTNH